MAEASCPFCSTSVDQDLLRFGGTCPMCFGEIPGEEALTDPGEEAKAEQDKKDARARIIRLIPFAMGLVAVLMAVVGAAFYVVLFPPVDESLELVDFDEIEFDWESEELEFAVLEDPDAAKEEEPKAATPKSGGNKPKAGGIANAKMVALNGVDDINPDIADREVSSGGTRVSKGSQATEMQGDADIGELRNTKSDGLNLNGIGGPKIQRNGIPNFVLEDDNQIIQMAARVMKARGRELKACYNLGLKQDENLRGRWVANFTIKTDGHTKNIGIEATGGTNEAMEQCMVKKIEGWQFQKIYKELPVRKSFRFQPG